MKTTIIKTERFHTMAAALSYVQGEYASLGENEKLWQAYIDPSDNYIETRIIIHKFKDDGVKG